MTRHNERKELSQSHKKGLSQKAFQQKSRTKNPLSSVAWKRIFIAVA